MFHSERDGNVLDTIKLEIHCAATAIATALRSEERRVGKEC